MDNFEFYKELYYKENDRRTEVQNDLNIPIALITAISTALYFALTTFDYGIETFLTKFFCLLCTLSFFCILLSVYFLIKAFSNFTKGYEYSGIPYPQELFQWHKDLEKYYLENGGTKDDADRDYKNFLMENMVKHTDHNMFINDSKYKNIYKSKAFLIAGLIATFFVMIPYSYNFFNKKESVYKVELTKTSDTNDIQEINKKIDKIYQIINSKEKLYESEQKTDTSSSITTTTAR